MNGVKRMFVLEVSRHSQGTCIEGSKGAVRYWAALVEDDFVLNECRDLYV